MKRDPIFKAIDNHRAAYIAYLNASCAHSAVVDKLPNGDKDEPDVSVSWRGNHGLYSAAEIDALAETLIKASPLPTETVNKERAEKKSTLDANYEKRRAWLKKVGLLEITDRETATILAEGRATDALIATKPTTKDGIFALLVYIGEFNAGKLHADNDPKWCSEAPQWPTVNFKRNGKEREGSFEEAVLEMLGEASLKLNVETKEKQVAA